MHSKLVNKYMKDNINIIHVCIILFSFQLKFQITGQKYLFFKKLIIFTKK